jgi:GTP-binding protein
MKPLVAIVGRPNVGKSTFFNRMIGERIAVTADIPGTTRDRLYGETTWNGRTFSLIDTGGLDISDQATQGIAGHNKQSGDLMQHIRTQVKLAIEEADVIVFLVDAQTGATSADDDVAKLLRRSGKSLIVAANKADNARQRLDALDFYRFGLGEPIPLSSIQGTGTGEILDRIVELLPIENEENIIEDEISIPRIAIIGRPNVGKSSLLNAILGAQRSIVSDVPGTTRDAINTEIVFQDQKMLLIDTAGIRRRGKIIPGIEKYSVIRSTRAIEHSDIAVLLIDAVEGFTAQDAHIAGEVHESSKGIVIVVNKWDIAQEQHKAEQEGKLSIDQVETAEAFRRYLIEALKFIPYASIIFASAKTGYHVQSILAEVQKVATARFQRIPTNRLNEVVQDALQRNRPSVIHRKVLKIYYATQVAVNPPTFVVFVNDPEAMHFSFERYVENRLRDVFDFHGTAIRLYFRARSHRDE